MKPFATKACLRHENSCKEQDASFVHQTSKEIAYVTDEAKSLRGERGPLELASIEGAYMTSQYVDRRAWREWTAMILDDSPVDARLIIKALNDIGIGTIIWVRTRDDLNHQLSLPRSLVPDVLFVEPRIGGVWALQVLLEIRRHRIARVRDLSVVILTGEKSRERFQKACNLGISAFINKPFGVDALRIALVRARRKHLIDKPWTRRPENQVLETVRYITVFSACVQVLQKYLLNAAAAPQSDGAQQNIDLIS